MEFSSVLDRLPPVLRSIRWNVQSISLLIVAGVVLLGMAVVQKQASPTVYEPLFADQLTTASFIQRAEAALGNTELRSHRVDQGRILVPPNQRSQYLAALQEADCLPPTFSSPTTEALKVSSIIESWRKSTQRLHHAKEQRASLAICALPGVDDAFVFFDEKSQRSSSIRDEQQTTASAGIQMVPGQHLDLESFRTIQDMLLGLKAGLTLDDITVTDLRAKQSFRGPIRPESPETQAFLRRSLEQEWTTRLARVLSFASDAKVSVRVIPNTDGSAAESVLVSVGISSGYVRRANSLSANASIAPHHADKTRADIRSVIEPLIPKSATAAPDELIAVNIFDSSGEISKKSAAPFRVQPSALLTSVLVVALVACIGLLMMTARETRPRLEDSAEQTSLRLYESHSDDDKESAAVRGPNSESTTKLRAYVEDDPDAVAKTLSEFIDRAS